MGIVSSIIDFVFPIQRRLYNPIGRFTRNPNQFRSPNMQRRFMRRRLWPTRVINTQQRISINPASSIQFRRPLARTLTPQLKPLASPSNPLLPAQPIVAKKSFWSEMFSPNITPPSMQPQKKRNGFGSTALNLMRWNNMLRR